MQRRDSTLHILELVADAGQLVLEALKEIEDLRTRVSVYREHQATTNGLDRTYAPG